MGGWDGALRQVIGTEGRTVLLNTRTGMPVAERVEAALDRASRRRGLLGRPSLPQGHALVLAPCPAVHTWFMQFAVDAVFVDRAGFVVKVVSALRPWRAAVAARAYAVVELPAGTAAATGTVVGDRLAVVGC